MIFDIWLAFAVASFILLVIPGPTILLVISYALGLGRRPALAMVAGVALGDLVAMTLTLMGLGTLVAASPTLFLAMKWAGALYLAWMGLRMIATATNAIGKIELASRKTASRAFFDAALVTLLNPKSFGFFIAFVPQFIQPDAPLAPQFSVMIATFVGLGSFNALIYALLASRARALVHKPVTLAWMQRGGGITLLTMAAATAMLQIN